MSDNVIIHQDTCDDEVESPSTSVSDDESSDPASSDEAPPPPKTVDSFKEDLALLYKNVTEVLPPAESALPLTARFKHFMEGTTTFNAYQSLRLAKTSDFDVLTDLPPEIPLLHWIKVNVAEFYNSILLLCESVQTVCTETTCPGMSAGPDYSFLWAEGEYRNNPTVLPAKDYIRRLLEWADGMIQNEQVFPSDDVTPPDFNETCDVLSRRLLRAPMHIYHHHYDVLKEKGQSSQLDSLTLKYCIFALKFNLFRSKDRILPILGIIEEKLPMKYRQLLAELPMHSPPQK